MQQPPPNPLSELWLQSSLRLPQYPPSSPPTEQIIAELLAHHPWSGFTQGTEIAFLWEYLDRPEVGTALLCFLHPPTRAPPPDGLRYAPASPAETVTQSNHVVTAPTSASNPTQLSPTTITLTCYTSAPGHFPPLLRSAPLAPDSPDRVLSRIRKRYHISRGAGHISLFFVYYTKTASPLPLPSPAWETEPTRAYPLSKIKPPDPVYIFGGRNRPAGMPVGQLPGATPYFSGGSGGADLQQHQQLLMAQQARARAQAQAQAQAQLPPPQQQQPVPVPATGPPQSGDSGAGDILDAVTARQLAAHRFGRSADAFAGVWDPMGVSAILEKGALRMKLRESAGLVGTGELVGGKGDLATRRDRLEKLRAKLDAEIEEEEDRWSRIKTDLGAT